MHGLVMDPRRRCASLLARARARKDRTASFSRISSNHPVDRGFVGMAHLETNPNLARFRDAMATRVSDQPEVIFCSSLLSYGTDGQRSANGGDRSFSSKLGDQ